MSPTPFEFIRKGRTSRPRPYYYIEHAICIGLQTAPVWGPASVFLDLARELGRFAGVAGGGQLQQPRLVGVRKRKAANECAHRLPVDALAARQRLELLVGI